MDAIHWADYRGSTVGTTTGSSPLCPQAVAGTTAVGADAVVSAAGHVLLQYYPKVQGNYRVPGPASRFRPALSLSLWMIQVGTQTQKPTILLQSTTGPTVHWQ